MPLPALFAMAELVARVGMMAWPIWLADAAAKSEAILVPASLAETELVVSMAVKIIVPTILFSSINY
nr:hypothetical protein TCT1_37150 [Xenorhabdus sp. TCT-1]